MPHWVCIERDYGPDLMIGPYQSGEVAGARSNDATAIDAFCEEDCLDAFTTADGPEPADEQVTIGPEDVDFSARPAA